MPDGSTFPGLGAASQAPNPDRYLLDLCDAFQSVAADVAATNAATGPTNEEITAASTAFHLALVDVSQVPARTHEGVRAKAAVCKAVLANDVPDVKAGRFGDPANVGRHEVLMWSLLRDILQTTIPAMDAPILDACAEFMALSRQLDETDGAAQPSTAAARKATCQQRRIFKAQRVLAKRLERMVPATLAGHSARARCLVSWAPDLVGRASPHLGETGDRIMRGLLRDLLAGSAQA